MQTWWEQKTEQGSAGRNKHLAKEGGDKQRSWKRQRGKDADMEGRSDVFKLKRGTKVSRKTRGTQVKPKPTKHDSREHNEVLYHPAASRRHKSCFCLMHSGLWSEYELQTLACHVKIWAASLVQTALEGGRGEIFKLPLHWLGAWRHSFLFLLFLLFFLSAKDAILLWLNTPVASLLYL